MLLKINTAVVYATFNQLDSLDKSSTKGRAVRDFISDLWRTDGFVQRTKIVRTADLAVNDLLANSYAQLVYAKEHAADAKTEQIYADLIKGLSEKSLTDPA